MKQMIILFIALAILSLIFWVIERKWPAHPDQPRWWKRDDRWTDLTYWLLGPLLLKPARAVVLVIALVFMLGIPPAEIKTYFAENNSWISQQPFWLQFIAALLIGDLVSYWMHRLFHRGWLWKVHSVHHSPRNLDWLAAARVHPLNDWLQKLAQLVVVVLLGFSPQVIGVYAPFLILYALLLHANVNWDFGPLKYVIASPVFHRWHHTSDTEGLDKNFAGFFPFIDLLFGTFYMPKGRYPQQFGLFKEEMAEGFIGQLLYPFRRKKT